MSDQTTSRSALAAGVFFMIVGTVFLLAELTDRPVRITYLLPLLLIGIGVSLLLRRPSGG